MKTVLEEWENTLEIIELPKRHWLLVKLRRLARSLLRADGKLPRRGLWVFLSKPELVRLVGPGEKPEREIEWKKIDAKTWTRPF